MLRARALEYRGAGQSLVLGWDQVYGVSVLWPALLWPINFLRQLWCGLLSVHLFTYQGLLFCLSYPTMFVFVSLVRSMPSRACVLLHSHRVCYYT
jgi:hypothetical protein